MDAASAPAASLLIAAGLVRTLGAGEYGVLVIALAVSGLSTAIIPAIAATTTKFVSAESQNNSEDTSAVARIITGSLVTVALIDLILLLTTAGFRRPFSLLIFGAGVVAREPNVGFVLSLAVTSICLQQIDGVFASALKGLEEFKRQAITEICSRAILVCAVLATTWMTHNVPWVLLAYCVACATSGLARAIVVKRSMKGRALLCRPHRSDYVRLMKFGGWMWLNALATIAYGTVDRIVIGRVSGSVAAGEYNVYLQLAQLVHFIPASLFAFSYPVFSRLGIDRRQNLLLIKQIYSRYLKTAIAIAILIAGVTLAAMHQLLGAIGGRAFPQHELPFTLLILGFVLLSLNIVPNYFTLGMGAARTVSLITSSSIVLAILAMFLLIPRFGITGAAGARILFGLCALTLYIPATRFLKS